MHFQPVSYAGHRALVCVRAGVGAVEYTHLAEQKHADAGTFALRDLGTQFDEQGLNVSPLDVGRRRARIDRFERASVFLFHGTNI